MPFALRFLFRASVSGVEVACTDGKLPNTCTKPLTPRFDLFVDKLAIAMGTLLPLVFAVPKPVLSGKLDCKGQSVIQFFGVAFQKL